MGSPQPWQSPQPNGNGSPPAYQGYPYQQQQQQQGPPAPQNPPNWQGNQQQGPPYGQYPPPPQYGPTGPPPPPRPPAPRRSRTAIITFGIIVVGYFLLGPAEVLAKWILHPLTKSPVSGGVCSDETGPHHQGPSDGICDTDEMRPSLPVATDKALHDFAALKTDNPVESARTPIPERSASLQGLATAVPGQSGTQSYGLA